MSDAYAREVLRRNVAQICQSMGWNGINSNPLQILLEVLEKYICNLGTQTNRYAEQFNRTEPNLHDLGLVFRDLHIQLPELAEYTQSVPPIPPPIKTEKFPKPKESNLNFLKPGSHEVVTRPMHVHEHLPPMFPEKERETPLVAGTVEIRQNGIDSSDNTNCVSPEISVTDSPEKSKDIFKRPTDPVSLPNSKRPRLRMDEDERTREISSVMMTMSGFLSPAREGKLPEAKAPIISEKHDKHKLNSNAMKVPALDKSDKKSKKNKLLNGKIMKSKRKEKSHKSESNKSKDSNKLDRFPPGYPTKNKDVHPTHHNHVTMPAPRNLPSHPKPLMPPPSVPTPLQVIPEIIQPVVKQEPIDPPPAPVPKPSVPKEDMIPVPRKIPISKSPLISNSSSGNRNIIGTNSIVPDIEIKKEVVEEEEKLASQPDRSKINIFKRISNKSKEDKNNSEVVPEKPQSDSMISKFHNSTHDLHNIKKIQTEESVINNNNSPVDLSKEIDIRAHEVISIDDDSLDIPPVSKCIPTGPLRHDLHMNKSFPMMNSRDLAISTISPKSKKEKKPKDKKDKTAKLEAKLKRQQQQIAFEMVQMTEKKKMKLKNEKPPKLGRPKNESKMPQMPSNFPFFPGMPPGRGMIPGPGLIPNPGLIPSNDFLAGLANNPALRGLPSPNLLSNPFALPGGPGLIPGPSFLPGALGSGIPNHIMSMSNFPHSSRSPLVKIPPMLRRPSLEVIPVDNENERSFHKSPMMNREKDRHDKHKSSTIPNILQKQKSKSNKDHKSNIYKMPPIQPDITIELNPPKIEPVRQELPKEPPPQSVRLPTPKLLESPCLPSKQQVDPKPEPAALIPVPVKLENSEASFHKELENTEKRKDKSHKKDKRDKDGLKIKKKKDKKDKNKEKVEKRKDKEEKQELKDKIKKERKEKKKEKSTDGIVPKLTLKLGSSNSNSPMPPSSPDIFKLNIKPVVKKEDGSSPLKDESISREPSRSPELAQISALVTRPPKQKHSKHNHIGEVEAQSSSPPLISGSPPRKNHPPSSHSKYKRILIKPLSRKGQLETAEDISLSEQVSESAPVAVEKSSGQLPTPYYVDEHGNKIWVCPACGRPDNGSPMIGCDGCDGWYHWVCVGITEEPGASEDWFCKSCLAKRAALVFAGVTSGKKRGRKPKGEKVREDH